MYMFKVVAKQSDINNGEQIIFNVFLALNVPLSSQTKTRDGMVEVQIYFTYF